MTYQVINPFIQFVDTASGQPLGAGQLYFGRQDSDPKNQPANRINVYAVQDNGSEVLLSQPVTLNAAGQPQYNGSVKMLKVETYSAELAYAVQVFNKNGAQKGYCPRVLSMVDLQSLAATNSTVSIGGVAAGIIAKHSSGFVTPEDFGALGNGVNDDTSAWQAAAATGLEIRCPSEKNYLVSQQITDRKSTRLNSSHVSVSRMPSSA